jgi:hypothetical protein
MTFLNLASIHPATKSGSLSHHSPFHDSRLTISPLTKIHYTTILLHHYTNHHSPLTISPLTTHLSLRVIFDRKLYREVVLSQELSRCLYIIYCLLSFLHRPKKKQKRLGCLKKTRKSYGTPSHR